jgi:predicted nucleic acid-binding protein
MTLSVALYLLDTDAVIDFFKGFPSSVELIQQLFQQGENLCTCAVVMAVVYAGLNPTERGRGEELLGSLRFFATSPGAARQAGLWRYAFARQGVQLATTDCLIAAVAHERGATLVTGNMDDYPMPELRRLPLPRRQRGSG